MIYITVGSQINVEFYTIIILNSEQSAIQLSNVALLSVDKLKYLGVDISHGGRWDGEIDRRIAAAGVIFQPLRLSIVTKTKTRHETKIDNFKTI